MCLGLNSPRSDKDLEPADDLGGACWKHMEESGEVGKMGKKPSQGVNGQLKVGLRPPGVAELPT